MWTFTRGVANLGPKSKGGSPESRPPRGRIWTETGATGTSTPQTRIRALNGASGTDFRKTKTSEANWGECATSPFGLRAHLPTLLVCPQYNLPGVCPPQTYPMPTPRMGLSRPVRAPSPVGWATRNATPATLRMASSSNGLRSPSWARPSLGRRRRNGLHPVQHPGVPTTSAALCGDLSSRNLDAPMKPLPDMRQWTADDSPTNPQPLRCGRRRCALNGSQARDKLSRDEPSPTSSVEVACGAHSRTRALLALRGSPIFCLLQARRKSDLNAGVKIHQAAAFGKLNGIVAATGKNINSECSEPSGHPFEEMDKNEVVAQGSRVTSARRESKIGWPGAECRSQRRSRGDKDYVTLGRLLRATLYAAGMLANEPSAGTNSCLMTESEAPEAPPTL